MRIPRAGQTGTSLSGARFHHTFIKTYQQSPGWYSPKAGRRTLDIRDLPTIGTRQYNTLTADHDVRRP
ncbi:unnamed protein product [Merluccius merluccius]